MNLVPGQEPATPAVPSAARSADPSAASRIRGCLAGLLAADAGLAGKDDAGAMPTAAAQPASPDAELALYTVDGLVEALQWANEGVAADETACLWLAGLRWARLRGLPVDPAAPTAPARPVDALLGAAPAVSADSPAARALVLPEMGTPARPVNPGADDDGALLRTLPAGLIPYVPEAAARQIAFAGAALTHGHQLARQAAAVLAAVVHGLAAGQAPADAAAAAAAAERAASGKDSGLAARVGDAVSAGTAGVFPGDPAGPGGDSTADRGSSVRRADLVLAAAVQAVVAAAAAAPQAAPDRSDAAVYGTAGFEKAGFEKAVFEKAVRAAAVAGPVAAAAAGALVGTWLGDAAVPGPEGLGAAAALTHVADELIRVTGA